jgi:hypothetical protein
MMLRSWRLAAVLGAAAMLATGAGADIAKAGKAAPAWSGKTVAGKPLSSAQLKNKVVLLNFFSYT